MSGEENQDKVIAVQRKRERGTSFNGRKRNFVKRRSLYGINKGCVNNFQNENHRINFGLSKRDSRRYICTLHYIRHELTRVKWMNRDWICFGKLFSVRMGIEKRRMFEV